LQSMWKSAVAWKYVTGELQIVLPKARKLRQRIYSQLEVKRILANTTGADQILFWLAAETGMRAGEIIALRVGDLDLDNLSVEISKSISAGIEDSPKSPAAFRTVCISTRLGAAIKEYLAGRTDGYLFRTSAGNPWDKDDFRARKLNPLLARLEIPKIDPKILARIIGKDRTIEQANRSEKQAASVGLHSFRHTNATAMDSLGIQHAIRKQRLGHSGNSVTENYTHTFTQDERDAADKLGEFFGTGWPEKGQGKLISFPNLSQTEKGPSAPHAESPCVSADLVAGARFERATFGL
jgi:integrase